MIIRLIILSFIIALHFLTPRYFFDALLKYCEWTMIFCMVAGIIVYLFKRNNKRVKSLSLILSINIAVYFLITCREAILDVSVPRMYYRLKMITGVESGLTNSLGYAIENFNYIQVLCSIIILKILVILLFVREKLPTNTIKLQVYK
jgi:predicted membrane protein